MNLVVILNPKSVLDIGTGFGKYGVLCREYLELWDGREEYSKYLRRIDGIEVCENYITSLHKFIYDHIYLEDVSKFVDKLDFSYDQVLLIDVLEHFNKFEGEVLLRKLLAKNKGIIVSTPKNPSNQKNAFGNVYETHLGRWTKKELSKLTNNNNNVSYYLMRDYTHLIIYIGIRENVKRLRRKLLLGSIKKVPGIDSLIPLYSRLMRKGGINIRRTCTSRISRIATIGVKLIISKTDNH